MLAEILRGETDTETGYLDATTGIATGRADERLFGACPLRDSLVQTQR